MGKKAYIKKRREWWEKIGANGSNEKKLGLVYRKQLQCVYKYLVGVESKVLEIGCGQGDLLASLNPKRGVGIDFAHSMIEMAQKRHPQLEFVCCEATEFSTRERFDFIILSDVLNDIWDVQELLEKIKGWCNADTRIILNLYSRVWQVPLSIGRSLGIATRLLPQNWLTRRDICNLLEISGYEFVYTREEILLPARIPILDVLLNRYLVRLFPFNILALTYFVVARLPEPQVYKHSKVSVIIPARNEKGNIPAIFAKMPQMGGGTEMIFVEGGSSDGTYHAIEKAITLNPEADARLLRQDGKGKGDAVRKGIENASGDVIMILDADLTVSPGDLPRFFNILFTGKAEFVNGVRLVYPMEDRAMRFVNFLGNKFFSVMFSWLLGRLIKDTLCGTKAFTKKHYEKVLANRSYFGDFDPFGDFELIFGAAKLNLKFSDLPIRYRERVYGKTNISRWKHGWILLKMLIIGMHRIKFISTESNGRLKESE